jgi:hypothetical protein
MPLPVGFNACAIDLQDGGGPIGINVDKDFREAGIFAIGYGLADYMRTHIENFRQLIGCFFWVLQYAWLDKNGLNLAACGENPPSAIENGASLGFKGRDGLLLFCAKQDVLRVFEVLEVKASGGKG